jgi:hypothetical protein
MKLQTWFDVENGVEFWHNLPGFKSQREEIKKKDGRYIVTYEKEDDQQSREQNNARWAIPYLFFEKALKDTGNLPQTSSKLDVHEWCMLNYLPNDYRERIFEKWKLKEGMVNLRTGEIYKTPFRLTTTKMSKKDSNNYYEAMQNGYAMDFSSEDENDQIPDPKKNWKNFK